MLTRNLRKRRLSSKLVTDLMISKASRSYFYVNLHILMEVKKELKGKADCK